MDPIATIDKLKKETFAQHEYKLVTHDPKGNTAVWLGKDPNKSTYWFYVIMRPGYITIYGDIREITLIPGHGDLKETFEWLADNFKNNEIYYMSTKVPHSMRDAVEGFDPEKALMEAEECLSNFYEGTESKEAVNKLKDRFEYEDVNLYTLGEVMIEILGDPYGMPDFKYWKHQFLYQMAALQDLVEKASLPEEKHENT